ncbi:phospholipase D [Cordyceps fumosorosea ARSEF 2679]|uniref:Phospholipase n=1 Tax=Cordyceps fumosorosea (strain ARSEF 2679) TaxID=1081104 RepID=A0A167UC28_CORFA|nr:phospholipase D [Cordyceps fumosorosea ARSEF 2679]OAA61436.1 phospholipase D [Cordyceps fumosorosea ARSEF 2679]
MEPDSQASEAHHQTPFKKVEAGLEALFGGEKHSHSHVGHVCDHLHPEHITNRYHSFAPETTGDAKWFVDGCSYFYAVSQALERAQESIYILDWWLSPELYLRRPPSKNAQYRLDAMLKAAAERGVTVNIIIYKEVQAALTLDSAHTKKALEALHPNIHVFRHPDHVLTGYDIKSEFKKAVKDLTHFELAKASHAAIKAIYGVTDDIVLYWAHHEKLLIVDSRMCFMGGLDLCFGRWDTNSHPIADAHPGNLDAIIFPGQDYNNARIFDFSDVGDWNQNKLDRTQSSRMGWSDVALCMTGGITESLVDHFVDRWNYIYESKYGEKNGDKYTLMDAPDPIEEIGKSVHQAVGSLRRKFTRGLRGLGRKKAAKQEDKLQLQLTRSCTRWSSGHRTEHSIANAYVDVILKARHFVYIENQFFITATSNKQHPVVNKIGAAIVQRIRRAHTNNEHFKIWVVMPAVPAFAGDLKSNDALGTRAIMKYQYNSISRGGHSIIERLRQAGIEDPSDYISFYNLRNFDRINTSATMKEAEIKAGVEYEEARKEHDDQVGAGRFPQGEGTGGTKYSYKQYQEQAQTVADETKDSIVAAYMDGRDELSHFAWDGNPDAEMDAFVSEELYIHSKLLIADDRLVICGSANLNDRSQLGTHDSEIAVVIENGPSVSSTMDGKPYEASKFASSLRREIFRKHLGLLPHQDPEQPNTNWYPITDSLNEYDWGSPADVLVRDPLHPNFTNLWRGTAKSNTEIFRKAFHPVPDDTVRTWKDYDEFFTKRFKTAADVKKENNPSKTEAPKTDDSPSEDATEHGKNTSSSETDGEFKKEENGELQQADENVQAQEQAQVDQDAPQLEREKEDPKKNEDPKTPEKVEYGHVVRSEFPGGIKELREWLGRVRGTLVEMPLDFLVDVNDIAKTGLKLNGLTEEIYT